MWISSRRMPGGARIMNTFADSETAAGESCPEAKFAKELPATPGTETVRQQLERILESREFQGSGRTKRFLRYVVEETLAGGADRIKAFTVAVAAFDRDETFNPQTDPIVRIEAGRLRRCLERYYLIAGPDDDVLIEIPKGSYVPTFSWAHARTAESSIDSEAAPTGNGASSILPWRSGRPYLATLLAGSIILLLIGFSGLFINEVLETEAPVVLSQPQTARTSIAVLPFESAGSQPDQAMFSAGMTNEIIRELSQHSGVLVLGPRALLREGQTPDIATIRQEARAAFVLSGDVQHAGDAIRVAVQLTETQTESVIWAESYDRVLDPASVFDLQAEIGREIVRKIAQPQGAIALFDWKRTRGMAPETWEAYDCVIQTAELRRRGELMASSAAIRTCLTHATERTPGYAEPWIMLSLLEVDVLRYTPQTLLSPEKFDAAFAAAQQGVDLAPDSGKAHMAQMLALFFRGDIERAIAVGDVALRLSPQDPDVIGEVGLRHVVGGNPDLGLELLQQAAGLYDDPPANLSVSLSLAYLRKGMIPEASAAIDSVAPNTNFVYLAIAAAIYGMGQRPHDANRVTKELLNVYPEFTEWAARELVQRYNAPDLAETLIQGWEAAGLTIDLPAAKKLQP